MYEFFLEKHNPEYVEFMKRKREALISHHPLSSDVVELKPIVTKHYYNDVFVSNFNIQFGYPRSDTCDTCDSLNLKIDAAVGDEKEIIQLKLQKHHEAAEEGYAAMHKDMSMCKESWSQLIEQ